jgi:hypothetical protein
VGAAGLAPGVLGVGLVVAAGSAVVALTVSARAAAAGRRGVAALDEEDNVELPLERLKQRTPRLPFIVLLRPEDGGRREAWRRPEVVGAAEAAAAAMAERI